ncbi:metal ABC transporter permease [Chitinispirillales bacterium ANBcel5]|uniref:metal ABC transporter permease n=1 Tax=Cellulosispirillum alkaliphilum TaxID=3039283 RepID=UPI002A4EFB83|nr:metal ABC transporter permease [Chitinispirillales bacterium ANBcel5]
MFELWYSFFETLPFNWAQYRFMQHAFLAVILISPLFALPGCLVVSKQMAFFSDAIGHAALTGIAIGAILGISQPLPSMLLFAVILSVVIQFLRRYTQASIDTVIGLVMAASVALGVVILSRRGGFNRYSRYLIGDLLSLSQSDIIAVAIVLLIVLAVWIFFFNNLFLISFNSTIARSRGVNVWWYELFFSALTAVIVTISVQWIGILVINSLLILPAAASRNLSASLRQFVLFSLAISFVSGLSGLILSYYWATASGATIVLVAMAFYIVSFFFARRVSSGTVS